jgi:hypothetical protein
MVFLSHMGQEICAIRQNRITGFAAWLPKDVFTRQEVATRKSDGRASGMELAARALQSRPQTP